MPQFGRNECRWQARVAREHGTQRLELRRVCNDAAITEDLKSRATAISASITVVQNSQEVAMIGNAI
jgi:hypothetical protein